MAREDVRSHVVHRLGGTYIFELKVDRPAAVAMDQTTAKRYAEPYLAPDKPVWLLGLSFAHGVWAAKAKALLSVPVREMDTMTNFTGDPREVLAWRDAMADLIDADGDPATR